MTGDPGRSDALVLVIGASLVARQTATLLAETAYRVETAESPEQIASGLVASADWIFDASNAAPETRRQVLLQLLDKRKSGALLAIDESILPLSELLGISSPETSLPEGVAITHLFIPLKHMRLAEIVAPDDATFEKARFLCESVLGRVVARCADRPGFIANRLGLYSATAAALDAMRLGMAVDDADAAFKALLGAGAGPFELCDLIGLDAMLALTSALRERLPRTDAFRGRDLSSLPMVARLLERGALGRTSGAGFYRRVETGVEVFDGDRYRPRHDVVDTASASGFKSKVASGLLAYAGQVAAELAVDHETVAEAMRLGFGWKRSPFDLEEAVAAGP